MNVYYKRHITWCKWPDNDIKDADVVKFSTSKKKFDSNIVAECEPIISVADRIKLVAHNLGISPKKVVLIKLN